MKKARSVQDFLITLDGKSVLLSVREYKTLFVVSFSIPYTPHFDFHKDKVC